MAALCRTLLPQRMEPRRFRRQHRKDQRTSAGRLLHSGKRVHAARGAFRSFRPTIPAGAGYGSIAGREDHPSDRQDRRPWAGDRQRRQQRAHRRPARGAGQMGRHQPGSHLPARGVFRQPASRNLRHRAAGRPLQHAESVRYPFAPAARGEPRGTTKFEQPPVPAAAQRPANGEGRRAGGIFHLHTFTRGR